MRGHHGPRILPWAAPVLAAALSLSSAAGTAQAQGQAAPAASTRDGLTYTRVLRPDAMMRVQDRLRQLGLYGGRVDGVWGPDSQAALERFQQSRGLQVTGQLNEATATTLGLRAVELLAGERDRSDPAGERAGAEAGPAAALSGPGGLPPETVRAVQARLRSLGFYRDGVDGLWGPGTQSALERFQQGRALQPTGQLNPATAEALGLEPARPALGRAPGATTR